MTLAPRLALKILAVLPNFPYAWLISWLVCS